LILSLTGCSGNCLRILWVADVPILRKHRFLLFYFYVRIFMAFQKDSSVQEKNEKKSWIEMKEKN